MAWDGGEVPESVHDIWITDAAGQCWIFQIMVFDDDGNRVSYRRDRRINWAKESHAIELGGIRLLNPFITMLYRSNKKRVEDKEVADIINPIETHAGPGTPAQLPGTP